MKEAKQDNQPETMGNESTNSEGLASVTDNCMSGRKSSSTRKRQDLVRTTAALWLWGPPNVLVILGSIFATSRWNGYLLPPTLTGVLLTLGTVWFGVACYWNGRRCGRTHCKIDGTLFPLLSLVGVVNLVGVTSFGWMVYAGVFWLILFISYVPEFFGMTYLTPRVGG
jgi:hypothetical protein